MYFLVDLKRTVESGAIAFWKWNKAGYTYKVEFAGLYSKEAASEIVDYDLTESTVKVPVKLLVDVQEKGIWSQET